MQRRGFLKLSGLALGAAMLDASGARLSSGVAAATPIALGAYISGAPDDPTLLDGFTGMVGVAPAVVMWYQDWAHSTFDPVRMDAVAARGLMPMVTWEPWDYTRGANQPAYALKKIIGGAYDAYLHQWARAATAWGKPFYLRFAHEMNANWYPWGAGINGNTPSQYVSAWRHVAAIFRQEGATNVRWVWCPNVGGSATAAYRPFYPGDAYVGWVGMDGYNWGTTQTWSHWQDLATVFGGTYSALASLTAKPMMIGETASAEQGGNKPGWITTSFLNSIPARFPRIRAVIWFDENKETDWRVNSSSAALVAYRQIATSTAYQGRLA